MADQTSQSYLFVAIGRATHLGFEQIKKDRSAAGARSFLNALPKPVRTRSQDGSPTTEKSSPIDCLRSAILGPVGIPSLMCCAKI